MRVLYFDAFAGVSGDMTVGALLSLGLPLEPVRAALAELPLEGYEVGAFERNVHGIRAWKFQVRVSPHARHAHRSFRDIRAMLHEAKLEPVVRQRAVDIFQRLAVAEGRVHGVPPEDVVFHEIGAVDSVADIVATAVGLAYFHVEAAYTSKLPLGGGFVRTQHGPLPVPSPATVELLRAFPVLLGSGEGELVTPTGAAIVASVAQPTAPPPLAVCGVGYGAGEREWTDRPNLLRLILAEPAVAGVEDELTVIEANVDDAVPEWFDWIFERLFAAGARDVWLTPVQMKKNRPAVTVHALTDPPAQASVIEAMLNETTSLGVRVYPVRRQTLVREVRTVQTPYGDIQVKLARMPDGHWNVAPEYEDCRRAAQRTQTPLKLVYQAALAAALRNE